MADLVFQPDHTTAHLVNPNIERTEQAEIWPLLASLHMQLHSLP